MVRHENENMTVLFIALPADSCMTVYCAGTRFLLFLTCLSVFHFSCAFESICAPSIRLNQSRRVMAFHNTLYKLLFTPRTAEQTQIAIDIVTATSPRRPFYSSSTMPSSAPHSTTLNALAASLDWPSLPAPHCKANSKSPKSQRRSRS